MKSASASRHAVKGLLAPFIESSKNSFFIPKVPVNGRAGVDRDDSVAGIWRQQIAPAQADRLALSMAGHVIGDLARRRTEVAIGIYRRGATVEQHRPGSGGDRRGSSRASGVPTQGRVLAAQRQRAGRI